MQNSKAFREPKVGEILVGEQILCYHLGVDWLKSFVDESVFLALKDLRGRFSEISNLGGTAD